MQQQWTISWSDYNVWWKVDFIWQPAQWLDGKEAPKHFPKPNLHQNKRSWSVWWSAASLIHYSFLNPSETITSEKYAQQIDKMNRKLQSLQLALVNTKGPILLHDNARPHIAQPTGCRKWFPRVHKIMDFYATGINKLISHWQKRVDCNGSYFD